MIVGQISLGKDGPQRLAIEIALLATPLQVPDVVPVEKLMTKYGCINPHGQKTSGRYKQADDVGCTESHRFEYRETYWGRQAGPGPFVRHQRHEACRARKPTAILGP